MMPNTIQEQAQANVPMTQNNGNPFTIYNQTPAQGGYLPPVSNAYDQWRINPTPSFGTSPFPLPTGNGAIFTPNLPPVSGGGGTIPTLPGSNPATTPPTIPGNTPSNGVANPGVQFPVGSGGWMLGGPTYVQGGTGLNGTMNTGYTTPGFGMGIFGSGYNGMTPSNGSSSGFSLPNFNNLRMNPILGNIADFFLPGDAIQNGNVNWQNLGLGAVDQVTGLPVTWGLDRLANSNWAQNSDSSFARWLRGWDATNDSAALQEWYTANGYTGAPTGWLTGVFDGMNNNPVTIDNSNGLSDASHAALAAALNQIRNESQSAEQIYRQQGAGGLINRINPATGQRYTPGQINAISRTVSGGVGIGNAAAGAFGSHMANALQGEDARNAFAAMYWQALTAPVYQHVDGAN